MEAAQVKLTLKGALRPLHLPCISPAILRQSLRDKENLY